MAAVDVLIPVYNAGKTVRRTLESVRSQTMTDFRVILVDDGSTDDSPAILAEMAALDPRIEVHRQPNGGIVDALNAGLRRCTAEYIARIDADDLCFPNRFEVQLDYLRANPAVVAVGAAARHIDADGKFLDIVARLGDPELANADHVPSSEPYIMHPFLTVRRAAVDAAGGYRYVYHAEDTDLYWRLRDHGRLVNLDEILGDYRMHTESVSSASILNGRIAAMNSQLASLSEQRRQRGVADLVFRKESLAAYKAAGTLAAMIELAAAGMDDREHRYLQQATVGKLLELAAYRPYELDAGDCEYVGEIARRGFDNLPAENAGMLNRRICGSAARIAAAGRTRDALKMVPARLMPSFAPRYISRTMLPKPLSRLLRRKGTRASPYT